MHIQNNKSWDFIRICSIFFLHIFASGEKRSKMAQVLAESVLYNFARERLFFINIICITMDINLLTNGKINDLRIIKNQTMLWKWNIIEYNFWQFAVLLIVISFGISHFLGIFFILFIWMIDYEWRCVFYCLLLFDHLTANFIIWKATKTTHFNNDRFVNIDS